MLLPSVVQDASSEVAKVCQPMKLKVFVDDITAIVKRPNMGLPCVADKMLEVIRMEVVREGFDAVDHGRMKKRKNQGDCVMQLSVIEVSGMQQKKKEWSCHRGGNMRSGLEDEHEAVRSKRRKQQETSAM